jgi:hypothetical protein
LKVRGQARLGLGGQFPLQVRDAPGQASILRLQFMERFALDIGCLVGRGRIHGLSLIRDYVQLFVLIDLIIGKKRENL